MAEINRLLINDIVINKIKPETPISSIPELDRLDKEEIRFCS